MNKLSKKCLVCNKAFFKSPSNSKRAWKEHCKYCSRACYHISGRGKPSWNKGLKGVMPIPWNKGKPFLQMMGEKNPRYSGGKVTYNCLNCGIACKKYKYPDGKLPMFCSAKCHYDKYRTGSRTLRQYIWNISEYQKWRKTILQRDKVCVKCKSGSNLQVDHIISFAELVIKYKIKTIEQARKTKELFDINNGRVLCKSCHIKTRTWGINQFYINKFIFKVTSTHS